MRSLYHNKLTSIIRLSSLMILASQSYLLHGQSFITGFQQRKDNNTIDNIPAEKIGLRIIKVKGDLAKAFWELPEKEGKFSRSSLLSGAFRDEVGSLYSEFLTDRINKFKISVGSTLTATGKADTSIAQTIKNLQGLINGGGNIFLRSLYPLTVIEDVNNPDHINCTLLLSSRVAGNIPVLGNRSNSFTWNGDMSVEIHGYAMGANDVVGIMARLKLGILSGNDPFLDKTLINRKLLNPYNQFSLGLSLKTLGLFISVDSPVRFFLKSQRRNDNSATIGVGYQL